MIGIVRKQQIITGGLIKGIMSNYIGVFVGTNFICLNAMWDP